MGVEAPSGGLAMTDLLGVRKLDVRFGPIHAVRGISFSIPAARATALVGTNGAGKSTTLLAVANALPSSARMSGVVALSPGCTPSMVPERDKIFSLLSVAENLIAADRRRAKGQVRIDDVLNWFPRLAERRQSLAGNLSGGEQQMLAIGMALLGSPSLLILDEPTLGLAVPIIERICETLVRLRKELDLTLLVAEAEPTWLPHLADQILIITRGSIVETIDSSAGKSQDQIRKSILGLDNVGALERQA
jgi:branched-chain amino acid transport system ATP-binding protein